MKSKAFSVFLSFTLIGSSAFNAEVPPKDKDESDKPKVSEPKPAEPVPKVEIPVWEVMRKTAETQLVTGAAKKAIDILWPQVTAEVAAKQAEGAAASSAAAGGAAGANGPSAGTTALAIYTIGKGADNYSKAKNDKQKAYAVAEMGVGALTLIAPPAGALAGVCLSLRQMADSVLDMQSAARIAEIQARTLQMYRDIIEIKQKILERDHAALVYFVNVINELGKTFAESQETAKLACEEADKSEAITDYKLCFELSRDSLMEYSLLADLQRALADKNFNSPEIDPVMVKAGIGKEALLKQAAEISTHANEQLIKLDDQLVIFNKAASAYFMQQIREKNAMTILEGSMRTCSRQFDAFLMRSMAVRGLRNQQVRDSSPIATLNILKKFDLQELIHLGDDIANSGCLEIQNQDLESASRLAKIQAVQFFDGQNLFKEERELLLRSLPSSLRE